MMGMTTMSFAAQSFHGESVQTEQKPDNQVSEINPADLPAEVLHNVEMSYPGYYMLRAYIVKLGNQKLYKIILVDRAEEEVPVIVNEKGEEIKL